MFWPSASAAAINLVCNAWEVLGTIHFSNHNADMTAGSCPDADQAEMSIELGIGRFSRNYALRLFTALSSSGCKVPWTNVIRTLILIGIDIWFRKALVWLNVRSFKVRMRVCIILYLYSTTCNVDERIGRLDWLRHNSTCWAFVTTGTVHATRDGYKLQ